jgi:hypothetical protein
MSIINTKIDWSKIDDETYMELLQMFNNKKDPQVDVIIPHCSKCGDRYIITVEDQKYLGHQLCYICMGKEDRAKIGYILPEDNIPEDDDNDTGVDIDE